MKSEKNLIIKLGGKMPKYWLNEEISLNKGERYLILQLVTQFIINETTRANLRFNQYIGEYEVKILEAISVLKKISVDSKKYRKSMGLDGGFSEEERKELGIDEDGYFLEESETE